MQVRDEHVYREGPQGDAEAGAQAASLSSGWFPLSWPPFPEHTVCGAQREGPEILREQEGEVRL